MIQAKASDQMGSMKMEWPKVRRIRMTAGSPVKWTRASISGRFDARAITGSAALPIVGRKKALAKLMPTRVWVTGSTARILS